MFMQEYRKKIKSPREAIEMIRSGTRITFPLCCGLPQTLMSELINQKDRLKNVELVSGLQSVYPFLEEGLEDSFTYRTWQCSPAIRHLISKGTVKYIPMRQGDTVKIFGENGIWPVEGALIQVSPPDNNGDMSMSVSVGHALPLARQAGLVIAEVNQRMPRIYGDTCINISEVSAIVESDRPLIKYDMKVKIGDKEKKIGAYAADLIPDGAWLQVGIGAIPEAAIAALKDKKGIGFFGMGVDGIVDLYESGAMELLDGQKKTGRIMVAETLGSEKIFNFMHENRLYEGYPVPYVLNPMIAGKLETFISILSAIEVDLFGQVNSETVRGKQLSAIGGSFDFLEGAHYSPKGKSIIAMLSATPDNKYSRIVPTLPAGSAVTIPRHCVDYIITEYGIADLRGKTLAERAKALITIAHPDFREELEKALTDKDVGV